MPQRRTPPCAAVELAQEVERRVPVGYHTVVLFREVIHDACESVVTLLRAYPRYGGTLRDGFQFCDAGLRAFGALPPVILRSLTPDRRGQRSKARLLWITHLIAPSSN